MIKLSKKDVVIISFALIIIMAILFIFIVTSSLNDYENAKEASNFYLNEMTNTEKKVNESDVFLKGTNGKEFYKILCEVAGVEEKEGLKLKNIIDYASSNTEYGIAVETNDNNEINYISIYTLLKDRSKYENFFYAISRLEYNGSDRRKCFDWIFENLGKEANIKIGEANFKLYTGRNECPILEIYTDGNEEFQKLLSEDLSQ